MATLDEHAEELARLRERVDALEKALPAAAAASDLVPADAPGHPPTGAHARVDRADVFWALNALKALAPPPGAVLYTGSVTLPGGGVADWQYALTTDDLLARDWSRPASSSALAALGHPVRLRLLQAIATGTVAVSELAALEGVGTTGQVYHHVNQLINAGWVQSTARGHYGIPAERVVPLLVVVLAAGGI
jgi:hypothetical protein